MSSGIISWICILILLLDRRASAYTSPPRWGQAVALINDALYVYGGKTDESNMYSYSSAPPTNDLFYLPLSSAFTLALPPWQLLSNTSSSRGPTLAWHTLTAYDATHLLSFGGDPGPNSPTVLPGGTDSVALLDVHDPSAPSWMVQPQGWANEPARRIRHSASYAGGKIYVVGGTSTDGSRNGFVDHYVFDPSGPSFTSITVGGGPAALFGHGSVVTSDGQLLVFGGYWPLSNALAPMSTIWTIDTTQANPRWSNFQTTGSAVPVGRQSFAAAVVSGGKIVIHGGTDATMLITYSDAWVLDIATRAWSKLDALEQLLGQRRDHFAIGVGTNVLCGFGYGQSGPVSSAIHIFDFISGGALDTFTPPPAPSRTPTSTPSRTTSTRPSIPASTTFAGSPSSTLGSGGVTSGSNKTGVAVGSTFGVLGVVVAAFIAVYYVRQRRQRRGWAGGARRFHPLGGSGFPSADEDSHFNRDIPIATLSDQAPHTGWLARKNTRVLNALGFVTTGAATGRRNLLADEDTRDFGDVGGHGRDGSDWTVFSLFGGAAGRGRSSREGSLYGHVPYDDLEKAPGTGHALAASAPTLGYDYPSPSYVGDTGKSPYVDPFSDPYEEEEVFDLNAYSDQGHQGVPPVLTRGPRALSPLIEQKSLSAMSLRGSSASTYDGPVDLTGSMSAGSQEIISQSTGGSLLDVPYSQPIRRSDSWWSRFSRPSFLDRRSSDSDRTPRLDFRDPRPAPRLDAIRETQYSASSDIPPKQATLAHGRSISSMKTTQTANSETIERMAAMDVIQRAGTVDSYQSPPGSGRTSPDLEATGPSTRLLPLRTVSTSSNPATESESPIELKEHTSTSALTSERRKSPEFDSTSMSTPGSPLSFGDRSTRHWEDQPPRKARTSVKYGLVQRPSLYVANPDHSLNQSSNS